MFRGLLLSALLVFLPTSAAAAPGQAPLILAAASLQESLSAAADAWARTGHPRPVLSFAASSALARQASAGAPADLFFSADVEWMDYLAGRGLLAPGTRSDVLANRLVLVAPASTRGAVALRPAAMLARTLAQGALAMADPQAVPAGRYGKAALTRLGVWNSVAPRVVRAENVRAALALVGRGAARFGIVYATDARVSKAVRIVAIFPAASHSPIVYPLARLKTSQSAEAEGFRRFLTSSQGRAIFARFGFATP
jgi:molybdate transport system substrate-binding protein